MATHTFSHEQREEALSKLKSHVDYLLKLRLRLLGMRWSDIDPIVQAIDRARAGAAEVIAELEKRGGRR